MAEVTVLTGSHLSDRRARIHDVLQQSPGRAIVLLPSLRLAHARRDEFLTATKTAGIIGAPFKNFDQFASAILEQEGQCPETLSDFQRGLLIQEVISDLRNAGELGAFETACATPGFAAHALRIITQLKQAGVDHDLFANAVAAREHPSGFDPIVSKVYSGYQKAVIETGVYDRVGVIWQAETLARDGALKALAGIDTLVLDAFDDFTPSELRLIEALCTHVESIYFGFAHNISDPSQDDMYALPRATCKRVCRVFDVKSTTPCTETDPATFSMFVAQHVFWRSEPLAPPAAAQNLALVEYRDAWTEIEATGRTVKSLLLEGVAPESIAILHRDIADAAPTLRCVFSEFGIPITITANESLRESSLATFVMELLEASETWERDRIAGILTSPWFTPLAPDAFESAATYLLARMAGVIQGYRDWSRGLESLHDRLTSPSDHRRLSDRLTDPAAACSALLGATTRLHELTTKFPARAQEGQYVEGLIALLDALQLNVAAPEIPNDIDDEETSAIERIYELLRKWQAWRDSRPAGPPITRTEFLARLRRALRDTPAGRTNTQGGVWCAGMEEARHLSFAHVFVIGMNEGTVPRPAPVNAIYGRADLEAFAEQHIELDSHQRHTEREMLLLHRCMSTAEIHLTVSWHAVDAAGKSRAPSPFIADIESVNPNAIAAIPGGGPYPTPERAASPRDLAASLPIHPSVNAALGAEFVARFTAGAAIERARLDASPFADYDGMVRGASAIQALSQRFGEKHIFSVNQFETYASCPFRFFMERVLAIPEDLPPDTAIDPRHRGQMLHHILRAFHERFTGQSVSEIPEAEMFTTLDECIEAEFEPLLRTGSPHTRTLWHLERVRARKLLTRHLRRAAAEDDEQWRPQQFELSFGRRKHDDAPSSEQADAFVLETPAGPVRFSGQIDRIDRAQDLVRIVDYKTTLRLSKKEAQSAESLQLPIYGLAWNAMHPDTPCKEAAFVEIGSHKIVNPFTRNEDWDGLASEVRDRVAKLAQAIRAGVFPPDAKPGGCFACSARRACRYEQGRIERKQADAP